MEIEKMESISGQLFPLKYDSDLGFCELILEDAIKVKLWHNQDVTPVRKKPSK